MESDSKVKKETVNLRSDITAGSLRDKFEKGEMNGVSQDIEDKKKEELSVFNDAGKKTSSKLENLVKTMYDKNRFYTKNR